MGESYMLHYSEYVKNLMQKYPEEARVLFAEVEQRLDNEPAFGERFDALVAAYMIDGTMDLDTALDGAKALADDMGYHEYTMHFIYIMNCTEYLKDLYVAARIPDEVFDESVDDLRCKLLECMECEHVPGTFVAGWNNGYLKMKRFAYGRFQYEERIFGFDFDFVTSSGRRFVHGDRYINFHIPSSGIPLTDEVRFDSYRKAYPHYKHLFKDGIVVFGCGSWLLYPRHREFLPEWMNIRRFMDDFEIVSWEEKDHFGNDWRVFGHYTELPMEQWPRDTALRKAYAEWLLSGHKAGDGFGIFLFDGEKIIR